MGRLIATLAPRLLERARRYRVEVYGERRAGRGWEAWLEFVDDRTGDRALTAVETTQRDLRQLRSWANGLTGAYLEGAYARARRRFGAAAPSRFGRAIARRRGEGSPPGDGQT